MLISVSLFSFSFHYETKGKGSTEKCSIAFFSASLAGYKRAGELAGAYFAKMEWKAEQKGDEDLIEWIKPAIAAGLISFPELENAQEEIVHFNYLPIKIQLCFPSLRLSKKIL